MRCRAVDRVGVGPHIWTNSGGDCSDQKHWSRSEVARRDRLHCGSVRGHNRVDATSLEPRGILSESLATFSASYRRNGCVGICSPGRSARHSETDLDNGANRGGRVVFSRPVEKDKESSIVTK